jgi:hypothetical protein
LTSLKLKDGLASSAGTTFVALPANFVADAAENTLQQTTLQGSFVPDTTPPLLASHALDMNASTLSLTFNEPVNVASFNASKLLARGASLASSPVPLSSIGLLGVGNATVSLSLTFRLSTQASDALKLRDDIAAVPSNTFLFAASGVVDDSFGNPAQEIAASSAIQADSVESDVTAPRLLAFTFSMQTGELVMTFDEPMRALSVATSLFNLAEDSVLAAPISSLAATASAVDGRVITLTLSGASLNDIKTNHPLCFANSSCFLEVDDAFIADMAGNNVSFVRVGAQQVFADTQAPDLSAFVQFNLNEGTLALRFSETVNVSTVDVTELTLQSLFEDPASTHTLSPGTTVLNSSVPSNEVRLRLSSSDLNTIKADANLCALRALCYVRVGGSFVADMAGNLVNAVQDGFPGFLAQAFQGDTGKPELVAFTYNVDTGNLAMTFDEPVDTPLLTTEDVSLSDLNGTSFVNLTSSDVLVSRAIGTTVLLFLSEDTQTAIKRTPTIAKTSLQLALSAHAGFVVDTASGSNSIEAITLHPVDFVTTDSVNPNIEGFELDLSTGILTISFDEPMSSTLNVSSLELQSSQVRGAQTSVAAVEVTSATLDASKTVATLHLTSALLEDIKLDHALATSTATTFLVVNSSFASDTTGNSVVGFGASAALAADLAVADTVDARLVSFDLDLS